MLIGSAMSEDTVAYDLAMVLRHLFFDRQQKWLTAITSSNSNKIAAAPSSPSQGFLSLPFRILDAAK